MEKTKGIETKAKYTCNQKKKSKVYRKKKITQKKRDKNRNNYKMLVHIIVY